MAKADEKIEKVKAEAAGHYQRIREAGGALSYCIDYVHHIASLKGDGEHAVIRERSATFPKMAVQLAAVGAVQSARKEGVDAETMEEAGKWARAAWVHSAGHYADQPSRGDEPEVVDLPNAQTMAMIRKGTDTRKAKAAEQWDRLVDDNVDSLATLALFGHESAKPATRKDRWIAYAILAGLAAAIVVYGASNWYLSVKITAPYDTDEGLQQRRDATDRALAYDNVMSSTARRSGIFKLFLDWPMSPTDAEQAAFTEFATDVIQFHRGMVDEKLICGDANMDTDRALEVVDEVNENINLSDPTEEPFTRAQSLMIKAMTRLYPLPCK
jgi:hypothetical protein